MGNREVETIFMKFIRPEARIFAAYFNRIYILAYFDNRNPEIETILWN
jgi:hypothetical protein